MSDSIIERQAIRAALALAVASAHGQVAEAIADLREEAAQLIGICIKNSVLPQDLRQWCDGASVLVERLSADGTLPRRPALTASAAILRLRLAVVSRTASDKNGESDSPAQTEKKQVVQSPTVPQIPVGINQKKVMEFIEGHPDIRTKTLIDSLNGTLSPRTVKRCLKELCDAGLLRRTRLEDSSVTYRVDREM